MDRDHVDELIEQWGRERPELDTRFLALSARFVRIQRFLDLEVSGVLADHGLNEGESGVLATLRRSGPPFELTPTDLYRGLLLSSGAMTNRIDRLEARGLVRRLPDVGDRRRTRVALTDDGRRLIDAAMDVHTERLERLLEVVAEDDRARLEVLLRRVLVEFERDERDGADDPCDDRDGRHDRDGRDGRDGRDHHAR